MYDVIMNYTHTDSAGKPSAERVTLSCRVVSNTDLQIVKLEICKNKNSKLFSNQKSFRKTKIYRSRIE